MNELDALIELAHQHASLVMLGTKRELVPLFALINDLGMVDIVGCPWRDDEEKYRMVTKVKHQIRRSGATAYSFICEAWTAQQNHAYGPGDLRPAQRPDRREVVIACATNGRSTAWGQWGIERNEAGECIGLPRVEISQDSKLSSWLADLL